MNARSRSPFRSPAWTVAATCIGFAVVQLDVTIVNVALPRIASQLIGSQPIGSQLGGSVALLQWVVDAYALSFAVLLLSAGVLADRVGARRVYLAGFALFAVASAACGLAAGTLSLIVARALQGVGAALLVPSSLALLNRAAAHDAALRVRAVGWWTAAGGVSIAFGPVAGGLLVEAFGWRSIFLVNVPLCALGAWLTLRHVAGSRNSVKARRFDPAGQLLAIAALGALVAVIIATPALGVRHPLIAAGLGVTLLAGWIFRAVEAHASDPMLPPELFRATGFGAAVTFGVAVNLTYYGAVFVLSLYLQQVRGYPPFDAGLAYLPLTATFIVANLASARATARYGPRASMLAGAAIGVAGFALLGRLGGASSLPAMLPAFVLIPGGMGLAVPAMTTVVLSGVEARHAGTASGVLNAARQVGGAIGVAVFGALATGGPDRIISGVHAASAISVFLLAAAATTAWIGVRPIRPACEATV
ncbi:MAG TPA: MFS transporter [Casimicrobiaceae bacterium]